MTSEMVSLDNLVGLVSFFGIFWFRGVNIPNVLIIVIQEWTGGIFLGF